MSGVTRNIDAQRRVIIPRPTLEAAGMSPGDLVLLVGGQDAEGVPCIVMTAYVPGCFFCGTDILRTDQGIEHEGKNICLNCVAELSSIAEEAEA